jgi:DmsE family decaheme c-type cytochrome
MCYQNNRIKLVLLCMYLAVIMLGCNAKLSQLKESEPIIPMMEYEKMLLGLLTSDYVGNENCLKTCHSHDQIVLDFNASTMGDQLENSSHGMVIVDCESCHGPASEMMEKMEGLDLVKDAEAIIEAHKNYLLNYETLPAGAKSLICLKCHTTNATFNIHNWNASAHALSEVSCSDCHLVHQGADLITEPREIVDLCLDCHMDVSAEFSLPSHHPVKEGKLYCTDCHDPHGTTNPKLLKKMTQKETCGRCHTEKIGPFVYEHSDITEECTNCHMPHGAFNNNLLKLRQPFLCKQCHLNHLIGVDSISSRTARHARCTDCHSMIHGTDTPSTDADGGTFRK